MKSKKARVVTKPAPAASPAGAGWQIWAAAAAALVAVFWAYSPALHGPFLFDDTTLPFALPHFGSPLGDWVRGNRPVLMFTYWINARLSGDDTYSYHVVNVLLHCFTSGLVFLMVRRLLEWSGAEPARRMLLAGFAAGVFLLHPIQTEAVAYLAGRSEGLSVMLVFAAFTVFLYRRKTAAGWSVVSIVLLLFLLALLSKEHTIVLPALLLLTDYWWNPGFSLRGIRDNWKLYVPVALGAAAGVALFWRLIMTASTAGFGMKDLTWYEYFFTQCRALFVYLGLFVMPARLTLDWDFPISKNLLDHGAIFGLAALLALCAAAWHYRRRFPLASYGFFMFLVLMAPTSSILPIRDAIAERRVYFAMPGLLLIVVDLLSRWKIERKVLAGSCAAVVLAAAGMTYARAAVWSDAVTLWEDTAAKSPHKPRVHFQLGFAYFDRGLFGRALEEFEKTAKLEPPTYNLLIDWALAFDGLNRHDEALAKLNQAAAMERTAHVYTQIAKVYAEQSRWTDALDALNTAQRIDPNFAMIYNYRAKIHYKNSELAAAAADYQHALALDPTLADARQELATVQTLLLRGAH
jgi:tetratricopeptide (TPR) repeat protein